MSYHVYNTKGFILRSADIGEADRLLFVFTEEAGLLHISVRSVRKITSKLRYSLRNFSFSRFALVRGKHSWRLIDAEELISFSPKIEPEKLRAVAGVFSLLSRLLQGEEENRGLFTSVLAGVEFLKTETLEPSELAIFETLLALKVLASLGYVGESAALRPFLSSEFSRTALLDFAPHRRTALREVNRALEDSQL